MTLADAIRKGAMQRPQHFGALFSHACLDDERKSCAMGAAYEAVFGTTQITRDDWPEMFVMFPELLNRRIGCPGCNSCSTWALQSIIEHLNDAHDWTREAIADWLDGLDAAPSTVGHDGSTRVSP